MKLIIDEQQVFCSTAGQKIDPRRESVVFVHGAGQDHSIWVLAGRYFARHNRNVLSVDLPGHGRSQGDPLPSISEMVDWLRSVMKAAGISQASIVGHSMGSLVALAMASQFPNEVKSVAMVATAVPMRVSDSLLAMAEANDDEAVQLLTLWGHSARAHLGGSPTPGLWMLNSSTELMRRSNPDVLFTDLSACQNYSTGLSDAGKVDCPVLLVLGERDAMTPVRATKELCDALRRPFKTVIPAAGHSLLNECPDQVLDALIPIVEGG
ncbi:MAG: alpha/beta hydrolase [Pirellulaceae bacterium]|nr:alpha/beta hydrolase [Pirellulaceae bacterium]